VGSPGSRLALARRADAIKLKALHWRKLPASSASDGSVWAVLAKQGLAASREHEVRELERSFCQKEVMKKLRSTLGPGTGPEASALPIEFLSAKRAQNIAIGLKMVQSLPMARLAQEIQLLNPAGLLSWDDAAALLKIVPTEEEAAAARALRRRLAEQGNGSLDLPASMREGERFVLHVLEVPAYERKLEVISLLASFETSVTSISAALQVLLIAPDCTRWTLIDSNCPIALNCAPGTRGRRRASPLLGVPARVPRAHPAARERAQPRYAAWARGRL
jgi:hypothetical protein